MKGNFKYNQLQKQNCFNLINANQNSHSEYYHLLKKIPFEESQASDMSSIISDIEPTSKQLFNPVITRNKSNQILIQDSRTTVKADEIDAHLIFKKNKDRNQNKEQRVIISVDKKRKQSQEQNSEIKSLKQINKRLYNQNTILKKQISKLSCLPKSKDSKVQLKQSNFIHTNSFDSFNKIQQSNQILKNKLNLNKKSEQQQLIQKKIRELDRPSNPQNKSIENNQIKQNNIFSVSSVYSKIFTSAQMPSIKVFLETLENYLKQYEDTFIKIKFIFENLQHSEEQEPLLYNKCKQLISLFKVPVLYKNKPKIIQSILNMNKSSAKLPKKQPIMYNSSHLIQQKKSLMDTFSPQLLSTQETFKMLEQILKKVSKSQNMIKHFRENSNLLNLLKKIQSSRL